MAQRSTATEVRRTVGSRSRVLLGGLLAGGVFLLGLFALGIAGIQAWEYSNSVSFCTNSCHDVHPEEPIAYQDSYHAQVRCTECHMGRVSTLRAIMLKAGHARHLPAMVFDRYDRPLESKTMRPANESCERCHAPQAVHDSMAREIVRFLPDESNTERRTYLLLKTGAGPEESGGGSGIHWHIANPLLYIASDDQKQEILWVQTTRPDGRTVEYTDMLNPISPEELAKAEKRVMDCVDCHNRIGHAFPSSEAVIDQALVEGQLSSDLPFAKKEMLSLLTGSYTSQAQALAAAGAFAARYREAYPDEVDAHGAEIQQAAMLAQRLFPQLVFEEPGVTWQSFSDNDGHRDSPGCFRCHDGKHTSPEGETIRLQCNLCHSIPVTVAAGIDPPNIPFTARQEPSSHQDSNFIRDHRFQASDACEECHGEVRFGLDDSSFCANSACHGQNWPLVDLVSDYSHPIRLEGKHAEAACQSCHSGVQEIAYECASCHEPLEQPHYGTECQECHTASSFELASAGDSFHPMPLEGKHQALICASCHVNDEGMDPECSACHSPPGDHPTGVCSTCHTPADWIESVPYTLKGPPIGHAVSRGADCMACHDSAGQNWPAPANHSAYSNEQCSVCHTASATIMVAFDPVRATHVLEGQHSQAECRTCHVDGVFQGTPQDCVACHQDSDRHAGQLGQDCAQCHTPAGWAGASAEHGLTAFPLAGAHSRVACVQCHPGDIYAGAPQACVACHAEDDAHAAQFGEDCAECHTPAGWPGASTDHDLTGFLLRDAHSRAACVQCHESDVYAGTPQACVACHSQDDTHGGRFGQSCAQCHTPAGWPGATFDHGLPAFQLTGAHTGAACEQCHAGDVYAGTPQACVACHARDDRHGGQFGQNCAQCHTTSGWPGATFDHGLAAFQLTGAHTRAACVQCHAGDVYAGAPQTCVGCHSRDDRHGGQFGQDCAQCHTTDGWSGASFDHSLTAFQLTGAHSRAACVQCHGGDVYAGTPRDCASCHTQDDRHGGRFGQNCAQCHATDGWARASFDHSLAAFQLTGAHARAACEQCHSGDVYAGTPQACVACHARDDGHGGQFGQNCSQCHTTNAWTPAGYDGPHTFPFDHGDGGSNQCRACHVDTLSSYSCYNCHEHEPAKMAEKHREEGITDLQNCASCHPTGRKDEAPEDDD